MESKKNLIIITHGDGDGDGYTRACFGFKLGVVFVNMGVDVVVYLGGAASVLAKDDRTRPDSCIPCRSGGAASVLAKDDGTKPVDLATEENVRSYIDDFILNQGKIFVCCACYMSHCNICDERDIKKTLIKGIQCGGIVAMAELSLESKVFTF